MIARQIKDLLQISEGAGNGLMQLLSIQKLWHKPHTWVEIRENEAKEKFEIKHTINPKEIRSKTDLLEFLQIVGQSLWFKGHDRSKYPDSPSDDAYFPIFESMDLTQQQTYNDIDNPPDYHVVLASSEGQVIQRLDALKKHLIADAKQRKARGLPPIEYKIIGLGTTARQLGKNVVETEEKSQKELKAQGKEPNEMNMVTLLTTALIRELRELMPEEFKGLSYQEVNTISSVTTREDKNCVTTGKTADNLKLAIEKDLQNKPSKKFTRVAAYSTQPFVERQRRDIEVKLGNDFQIIGVGNEYTLEKFLANPKATGLILGEVARLINICYAKYLLIKEELAELTALCTPKLTLAEEHKSDESKNPRSLSAVFFKEPVATTQSQSGFSSIRQPQ